jgi:hypothetical protein
MLSLVLLAFISAGDKPKEKPVTAAEKEAFLKLLGKLPGRWLTYTDESVRKAGPHLRVLLALEEKDIRPGPHIDRCVLISLQLAGGKAHREYALKHFARIAHPDIKLLWAVALFEKKEASPEVVRHLRAALKSKDRVKFLGEVQLLNLDVGDLKKRVEKHKDKGKK